MVAQYKVSKFGCYQFESLPFFLSSPVVNPHLLKLQSLKFWGFFTFYVGPSVITSDVQSMKAVQPLNKSLAVSFIISRGGGGGGGEGVACVVVLVLQGEGCACATIINFTFLKYFGLRMAFLFKFLTLYHINQKSRFNPIRGF